MRGEAEVCRSESGDETGLVGDKEGLTHNNVCPRILVLG